NAGTIARFLPALAALAQGDLRIDGDPRLRERPLAPLLSALRAIGADIEDGGRGALPIMVHGKGALAGGSVCVDAAASSQFVTGLLLAAPRYDQGIEVKLAGTVPSALHLAMTMAMLSDFGAEVSEGPDWWRVRPGALRPRDLTIEPDLSAAAPFLAAALVTAGSVRIEGWPEASLQPGARLPDLLELFGGSVQREDESLTVTGPMQIVGGVDVDLSDTGELAPVLAAVASLADRPSRLRGIAHLRGHETDRLAALATELNRLGGAVRETPDGLEIEPGQLRGGRFATYEDHRLAMAAAVLGLVVPGIVVENVETTAKTFPAFRTEWEELVSEEKR
ncbi:MAG: 3-phosphoshikimate 1-carboxyvinyltransferase, partial [Mycobacteriales bacterium]